jgi:hypothetical protein
VSLHVIRAFLIGIILVAISSCTTTPTLASKWKIGDHVSSYVLCRNELIIMEIVKADTKSEEAVVDIVNNMILRGGCLSFPQPVGFVVIDIIVDYRDFRNRQSHVFKVKHAVSTHVKGYLIASGAVTNAI